MKKVLVVGAVAALLLAGCGSDSDGHSSMGGNDNTATSEIAASADFNAADVAFAQGMIPHHEQAVEMAEAAESRAESAEVKDLAARIAAAQGPEISQMQGWLEDWDQGEGDGSMGDMASMPGMMDDGDMGQMMDSSGADFDEMFLEGMIRHHEGAVEMATDQLKDGKNAEALALAEEIIAAQEAEIQEMQALLDASS